MKFLSKYFNGHWRKWLWKCPLRNGGNFVPVSVCLKELLGAGDLVSPRVTNMEGASLALRLPLHKNIKRQCIPLFHDLTLNIGLWIIFPKRMDSILDSLLTEYTWETLYMCSAFRQIFSMLMMRWCIVETNSYDLQVIMYPIIQNRWYFLFDDNIKISYKYILSII